MISKSEVLQGREVEYPLTSTLLANLDKLLAALNVLRTAYGRPMYVSSGYRPGKYNVKAGGALHSAHISCEACDFQDPKGELAKWCLQNLRVLEKAGLWMESPDHTKGWVHLQTRPVASGSRIFNP